MAQFESTVAVLMPVHSGVNPVHLLEAVQSLVAQVRVPDEIIVVLDGPVSQEHEAVLADLRGLRIVRLAHQEGIACALEAGLRICTSEYVARADSDDVNEPHRIRRQLDVLLASGADVCSAQMLEFESDTLRVLGLRSTPVKHEDFARQIRTRNPVNHPTAVFRRSAVVAVGGYHELLFLEDYDLWARMLARGSRFVGVAEPLVRFRADGMHERRTNRHIDHSERELQRRLVSYGLVSRRRSWLNLALRSTYRRLPRPMLVRVYAILFRRRSS